MPASSYALCESPCRGQTQRDRFQHWLQANAAVQVLRERERLKPKRDGGHLRLEPWTVGAKTTVGDQREGNVTPPAKSNMHPPHASDNETGILLKTGGGEGGPPTHHWDIPTPPPGSGSWGPTFWGSNVESKKIGHLRQKHTPKNGRSPSPGDPVTTRSSGISLGVWRAHTPNPPSLSRGSKPEFFFP